MDEQDSIIVEAYRDSHAQEWDAFVKASRNGTFLFERPYMDYHKDRFTDCSLVFRQRKNGRIICLLPASVSGETVVSHGGLTYGGFIMPPDGLDGGKLLKVMTAAVEFYRSIGMRTLRYKMIPHIYHRYPSDEDYYALFRFSARLVETNLSSAIELDNAYRFDERSRRNMSKAMKAGVVVKESDDLSGYWHILEEVLMSRHSVKPVHNLDEIRLLKSRFPENIRLFTATDCEGEIIAGSLLYCTPTCVHAQYIAASESGRRTGALSLLFHHIITQECGGAKYFDFGICNEDHGLYLNEGLLLQKNGFGGRGIVYNVFEIDL